MGIVSVAKADLAVLAIQKALVADDNPMGISPEVAEHRFGTPKGAWRRYVNKGRVSC